jgi:Protein of unknown function (DUF3551)
MRSTILFLIAAALLGAVQAASAQPPHSYPWCASYAAHHGSAAACHFTSHHQCAATVFGIRGHCYQNPHYHSAHRRQAHTN